jgi:two-component system invasion response regulator UvrY
MIRIAIAERHGIVRWALRQALANVPELEIVGDAGTVEQTLALISSCRPDVLVLDLAPFDHTGFDLLAALQRHEASPVVVVMSAQDDPRHAARAILAGAHGFVDGTSGPDPLIDAIRIVSRGEQVIPAAVQPLLAAGQPAMRTLTEREVQVMEMLARGLTNREVAEHLEISPKTVDTHRGHVIKKLGLRNNADLTRFAVKHGYVSV